MSNQQNSTWLEKALEIARRYHDTLCDYPKIYSALTEDEKNIQRQKYKEWEKQIEPFAGEFRGVYLSLKSQLGLPYEADELQWGRVHSDMDGLLLKIKEIIKKIEEHHWEMDRIRKQREEKHTQTGKGGKVAWYAWIDNKVEKLERFGKVISAFKLVAICGGLGILGIIWLLNWSFGLGVGEKLIDIFNALQKLK